MGAFSVVGPELLGVHVMSRLPAPDWLSALAGQGLQGAPRQRPDGDVELPDVELPDGLPRRPDGDVELQHGMRSFVVPPCSSCGGVLKPNVVFCKRPCLPRPMVTCALMGLS